MTTIIDKLPGRLMQVDDVHFEGDGSFECYPLGGTFEMQQNSIVRVVREGELSLYIGEQERKAWEAAKEGTTTAVDENSTGEWISIEDWRKKERER